MRLGCFSVSVPANDGRYTNFRIPPSSTAVSVTGHFTGTPTVQKGMPYKRIPIELHEIGYVTTVHMYENAPRTPRAKGNGPLNKEWIISDYYYYKGRQSAWQGRGNSNSPSKRP
jgi:hypothetical protein